MLLFDVVNPLHVSREQVYSVHSDDSDGRMRRCIFSAYFFDEWAEKANKMRAVPTWVDKVHDRDKIEQW